MNSERWEQVQAIFHAVWDIADPAVRAREIAKLAGGDAGLQQEVEQMLAHDAGDSVLDRGAALVSESTSQRQIGPYTVERVLGEGGMGTVFLARRTDLDAPAAIKVLRDAWISPARRKLFAQEERTLARLDHPNIARLLDADTLDDGTPYFVMEYVDGQALDAAYCDRAGHRIRERLQLFRAACEAVQFAHGQAVIHRDLKPSNILVRPDGTVKLLDFGIAKHLAAGGGNTAEMTRTGLRLLTPAYASPEQIRGDQASVQMDVYSLGVILHLLLSGRLPSAEEELKPSMIVRRSGQALLEATASEWADLDVLCLTAMHKDVQKRYGSVEALIRDIDHYLRAEPLEARPDSLGYRAGKFLQRNRRPVIAAGLAMAAVSLLIAFFVYRLAEERNHALAEAARTKRIQLFIRNLFQGGDSEAGPEKDMRVETLIDRGVQEARTLDKDPEAQAELYQTLGDIYHKLGKLEQAEAMLTAALEMRRTPDHVVALALLRTDQARMEEAEKMAREGLRLANTSLPAGHPVIASATDALGKVLEEKGDYDGAIRELSEAVRLRAAAGDTAEHASSLYELGNAYFYAGRYKECEQINLRVLAMVRKMYGPRHPRVSEALTNLGAIQQDTGNYTEAERYHREALELVRGFYGDRHYRTAASLTMIGRALVFQKRAPEAEAMLRQALEIQEQVFGRVHPRVASALNELGTVHLTQDRPAEARPHYLRMAEIYKAVYAGKHYLVGTALSNIGSTYMAEKNYPTAEPYFRDAVAMFRETQGADHINLGIAQIKLGRTLLRQNKIAEAERATSAGYAIVQKQVNPSASWLNSARADLEAIRKLK
ncbi:hypothetical protein F183_A49550 [Bryobacterales bacterium F-183]|nr:hypothetical protein F183_A49550 [Bryobacterales bacterium F-183]